MSTKTTNTSHTLLEHASESADAALQTTQRLAHQALDGVSHSLQSARDQVREGASQVSDRTVTYIREEPVKSVLIAAAAGAALVALTRLAGHSSRS